SVQELMNINHISNPNVIFPGTVLAIPFVKPVIDVNAYTINQGSTAGTEIHEVGRWLTYSSPFAYTMTSEGNLNPINDAPMITASLSEKVLPMLCITNFTYRDPGSRLAHTILNNSELQDRLINNSLSIIKSKGYRGINIDFENVLPEDREA